MTLAVTALMALPSLTGTGALVPEVARSDLRQRTRYWDRSIAQEVFTVDRIARITSLIDTTTTRGIEIAGTDPPLVQPRNVNIRVVGRPGSGHEYTWQPGTRLAESIGDWVPTDYVVAAGLLERVADPIDWLDQIAETLTDEGYLCLAIPDKRFTAQARQPVSSTGQILDANLRALTQPTAQQIFDNAALQLREPDVVALWNGRDPRTFERPDEEPAAAAYQTVVDQLRTGAAIDVPAHVFTDQSFADFLTDLAQMGLLEFAIAEFMPTKRFETEFFVTLQKLPSWLTTAGRRARQEAGFALCRERLARADRPLVGDRDEPPMLPSLPAVAAYVRTEGSRVARDMADRAGRLRTQAASLRERKKR